MKLPNRFLKWSRRGFQHEGLTNSQSECLIRCDPEDDMNGFFIALFVRKPILSESLTHIPPIIRKISKRSISSSVLEVSQPKRPKISFQNRKKSKNKWRKLHKTLAY